MTTTHDHAAARPSVPALTERTYPRRSVLHLAGLGGVSALWLAACAEPTSTSTDTGGGDTEGAMKEQIVVAVPALTPTLAYDGGGGLTLEAFEMNANLHAGLVRNPYIEGITPDTVVQDFNEYVAYVADSYEVSADGLTYTFRLREGLLSQSGNAFTADDVLWSFERKWNTPTFSKGSFAPAFTDLTQLVKVDDLTVAFTITEAGLGFNFLGLLANLNGHMYDSTLLRANATPEDPYAVEWSKTNPGWGFGPYTVETWTPDQEMVLAANANYAYGPPTLSSVVLRVVADPGTRASLVLSGDVDMAEGIRPADQAQLVGSEGVVVPEADPIEFIDLTCVTNKPPFDDEAVRQAMAWAVPYDEIVEQVYAGRAVRMTGSVNPNTDNYTTDGLPTYDYDPEHAKQLLTEAGYPDGVSFSLAVSNAVPDVVDTAILIQSYAADAGFTITIDQQPVASFGQGRAEATFQALMYRNRMQTQTPTYALTIFWQPGSSSNPSRWENQEFYDTVDAAIAAGDPLGEEAGQLWHDAMAINLASAPEIFIALIQPSQVYRDTVTGFTYRSENAIDFGNLEARA